MFGMQDKRSPKREELSERALENLLADNRKLLKRYEADPRWRPEAEGIRKRIERLERKLAAKGVDRG